MTDDTPQPSFRATVHTMSSVADRAALFGAISSGSAALKVCFVAV
jgi:hypothetical protein